MSTFKQDKEKEARDALVVSQTEAFRRYLGLKHPEVRISTGLMNAVREYMLDAFLTASDEDFEYALQNIDVQYMKQRVQTPEEVKAALTEKILELIASSNEGRDGKFDSHQLKTERSKMSHWSLPQLAERLEEVVRKQTLNAKPIAELRQIVVEGRRYTGYPQLGKTVVRPGTVRAVPLDAAYLQALDVWELKKYTRLYGVEQVNARLRGVA